MNAIRNLLLVIALTLTVVSGARLTEQTNDTSDVVDSSDATTSVLVSNSNDTTKTPDMAEALEKLLVAFKRIMPCGDPKLNIPAMAPYRIGNVPVAIKEELLTVTGSIDNLVMTGIDDFLIIELSTNATSNRTSFDMIYKGFQILAEANLSVNADIAGFRFIQDLKGLLNWQVLNVRVTGGMTIGTNDVGGMLFSDIVYYVQVGEVLSQNLDTKWSVAVNNFVNKYLSEISLLFLQTNREFMSNIISGYATPLANKAFYNISSSEFIEAMLISTELYNSIDCSP